MNTAAADFAVKSVLCPLFNIEQVLYDEITLREMEKNGVSTIKTTFSGEILEAREKEFFQGRDYGLHGLHLISSSYINQKMLLKQFVPEDVDVE